MRVTRKLTWTIAGIRSRTDVIDYGMRLSFEMTASGKRLLCALSGDTLVIPSTATAEQTKERTNMTITRDVGKMKEMELQAKTEVGGNHLRHTTHRIPQHIRRWPRTQNRGQDEIHRNDVRSQLEPHRAAWTWKTWWQRAAAAESKIVVLDTIQRMR